MPAHRNNWRTTVVLFALTGIVESFAFGHLNAFTPLYLQQLNVPPGDVERWTGILAAFGFVLGIPLLPFWGVWADRYGRKLIIVRSSYAGALMFALYAFSSNIWQLAGARLLVGLILGNTGVMLAVQAEITPRERLGSAIALVAAGPPLGMALGPLFGGFIVRRYGIPHLLLIDAALTAAIAVLLTVMLREEPRTRRPTGSTVAMVRESLQNIVHTPLVRRLFIVGFVVALGVSAALPFGPIRIERLWRGDPGQIPLVIGALLSASGIAMAITTPLWGRLSDRIGYVRVLRIGIVSVACTLLLQSIAWTLPLFAAGRLGQGLVQGGIDAAIVALVALRSPEERRAAILNLSRLPMQLSWFLGPILGSLLSPLGLPVIFGAAALCALIGFGITFALDREQPEVAVA
jgi:MFS transporter, DHA1 family, multidrug resistance protein